MNPAPVTPETTVGQLVRAVPARARLFEKLGIDSPGDWACHTFRAMHGTLGSLEDNMHQPALLPV